MAEGNKLPVKVNNLKSIELKLTGKSVPELTKNLNNHGHNLGSTNSDSSKRQMRLQILHLPVFQAECTNPDCLALVKRFAGKMVKKRVVGSKPILDKDRMSVFEVVGEAVGAHQVKNPTSNGKLDEDDVIYKIAPNIHAHITNVIVFVDEAVKEVTLRKLKTKDPVLMKLLTDTQNSADQFQCYLLEAAQQQVQSVISPSSSFPDSDNATSSRKITSTKKGPVKSAKSSDCINVLKPAPRGAISKHPVSTSRQSVLKRVAPIAANNATDVVSTKMKSKKSRSDTVSSLSSVAASSSTSLTAPNNFHLTKELKIMLGHLPEIEVTAVYSLKED